MATGAFTPFIAAAGLLLALVGGLVGSWWLAVPAALAALGRPWRWCGWAGCVPT